MRHTTAPPTHQGDFEDMRRNLDHAQRVAQIGSWHLDLQTNHLVWSDQTCRMFGTPVGTPLSYEHFLNLVHPDDRAGVDAAWQQALRTGSYDIEHRIVIEGEERWLRERAQVDFAESGTPIVATGTVQDITERRHVEDALRKSEATLRLFYDMPFIGMAVTSPGEKRWVEVNQTLCDILGYSREEVVQLSWPEVTHPDDLQADLAHFQRVVRGESDGYKMDKRFVRKDGTVIHATIDVKCVRDESGAVEFFAATVADITARVEAERAVRDSEARLATVFDSTDDIQTLYRVEPGPRLVYEAVNRAFRDTISRTFPGAVFDMIGRERTEWLAGLGLPREVTDPNLDHYRKAIDAGTPVRFELRLAGAADARVLSVTITPIHGVDGRCTHVLWTARDVTEERARELAILQARDEAETFRRLVTSSTQPIGFASTDLQVEYMNPALLRLLGLDSLEQARGFSVEAFYAPEQVRQLHERAIPGVEAQGFWSGEMEMVARDGRRLTAQHNLYPLTDRGGRMIAIANVLVDLSEQRRAEQERERLIGELEQRNTELERFTYTVSHDLKSPLITIKGFLGALGQDLQAGHLERADEDMKRIADAADRMGALLRDLLELSRVGRVFNPPELIPMSEVVQEAVELLAGPIHLAGAVVRIMPGLPMVRVDRGRMVEVLQNLIENAIKYGSPGTVPEIEIGFRTGAERVVFFVSDNGPGIQPKYHETIFGLFNKLNASSEGSGIGLALAKRIVDLHGGRIWVESGGAGLGATFCFTVGGLDGARELDAP